MKETPRPKKEHIPKDGSMKFYNEETGW